MSDNPMQRPEGELIQAAMRRRGVKAPWVAEKTGLSSSWVRHVVNGYEPEGQQRKSPVVGAADTIARIAHALDITPDQLTSAGRSDAARVLETIRAVTPALAAGEINRDALEAIANNVNRPDYMRQQAKAYLAVLDATAALLEQDRELREAERRRVG